MIKANELRIGNKIIAKGYDIDPEGNRVGNFEGDFEITVDIEFFKSCLNNPHYYEAIPITPEWLERCWFIDDLPWKKDNFRLDSENRFIVVDSTGYGIIIARHVQYIHQLQNIYFALTGEELNVKV